MASSSTPTPTAQSQDNSTNVPNFVDNVWLSGGDKKLITKDVYTAPSTDVISDAVLKPTSITQQATSLLGSGLKSLTSGLKTISTAIKTINDTKKALTTGNLASRILNGNTALQKALGTAGISIDPSTISTMNQAAQLSVGVNGAYKAVSSTNFSNIQSVGNLLSTYTKDNTLFQMKDLGADAATACTVINACVKNGVPNSVSAVMNVVGQNGPVKQIVNGCLSTVVSSSDIDAMHDLCSVAGNGVVKQLYPNVITDLNKAYQAPLFETKQDQTAHYTKTMSTYSTIDQYWCKNTVGNQPTVDVAKITGGNNDFKELVKYGALNAPTQPGQPISDDDKLLGFGALYPKTDVLSELKTQFPTTVVNTTTVTRNNTTSALLLSM